MVAQVVPLITDAFVVEQPGPLPGSTAQVWVRGETRAKEIVAQGALTGVARTYRRVAFDEMHPEAQKNMLAEEAKRQKRA